MNYSNFLAKKLIHIEPSGIEVDKRNLPSNLYDYQRDLVLWSLRRGKAALFTMTGTGKTPMQSTWAHCIHEHTGKPVIIFAPLAVAKQTVREAANFGISIKYVRHQDEVVNGVNIANYEMMQHFDPSKFSGIALDESSILKSFTGKMRNSIIEFCRFIPYRLACTATPAPNDFMELGNHAEFLGVMSFNEMLATYFVHDGGDTSKWRLKGHAEGPFWEWLAQWGAFLVKPSDLGYSDEGFDLPALNTYEHVVSSPAPEGMLFATVAGDLQERRSARKVSMPARIEKCAEIVSKSRKPHLIWCGLNAESEGITKAVPGCVEITGSQSNEYKESMMLDFAAGNIEVCATKTDIAGFGMNWQVCADTSFLGLSDSFESLFQATKRFHRHGQKNEVNRHLIVSESEGSVIDNIKRKESDFMRMIMEMVQHTKKINTDEIHGTARQRDSYKSETNIIIPSWLKSEACTW